MEERDCLFVFSLLLNPSLVLSLRDLRVLRASAVSGYLNASRLKSIANLFIVVCNLYKLASPPRGHFALFRREYDYAYPQRVFVAALRREGQLMN